MKRLTLWLLWLLSALAAQAQLWTAADYRPMPAAYSGQVGDLPAFTRNPALLAIARTAGLGIYGEQRFGLPGLHYLEAAACQPSASGTLGFSATYFGQVPFYEASAALSYGRLLGQGLAVGLSLGGGQQRWGDKQVQEVHAALGTALLLGEGVRAGLMLACGRALQAEAGSAMQVAVQAGLGYDLSPQVFAGAGIGLDSREAVDGYVQLVYRPDPRLWFRSGLSVGSGQLQAGLGYGWSALRLDLLLRFHPVLGCTPGLSLQFTRPDKS